LRGSRRIKNMTGSALSLKAASCPGQAALTGAITG
jgi:hypothetical protein